MVRCYRFVVKDVTVEMLSRSRRPKTSSSSMERLA